MFNICLRCCIYSWLLWFLLRSWCLLDGSSASSARCSWSQQGCVSRVYLALSVCCICGISALWRGFGYVACSDASFSCTKIQWFTIEGSSIGAAACDGCSGTSRKFRQGLENSEIQIEESYDRHRRAIHRNFGIGGMVGSCAFQNFRTSPGRIRRLSGNDCRDKTSEEGIEGRSPTVVLSPINIDGEIEISMFSADKHGRARA